MGRPRTATNILKARGSFKVHPERASDREDEPIVTNPFPETPPDILTDDEADCWKEIVAIAPAKVLTGADVIIVEMAACLLAEYRKDRAEFPTQKLTRLSAEINRLGLSPSSRASLSVGKTKGNKFDDV